MNAPFRPCGDYYSTGQVEWRCDDCDRDEWSCRCEVTPLCPHCDDPLPPLLKVCENCDEAMSLAPVVRLSATRVGA